jgi:hypothetical protein
MNQTNHHPEAAPKAPTLNESVDSLIAKKKAERAREGENAVRQSAENIQGEVADLMSGVEAPSDKISERNSENKGDRDIKSGGGSSGDDDGASTIMQGIAQYVFPNEDVMIKKVRTAIQAQIRREEKRAKKLEKNLTVGGAQEYNSAIARIRKLKESLSSLVTATMHALKEIYVKYFTPKGFRRPMGEILEEE